MPDELTRRARAYVAARRAQQLDHTDAALNDARTEAHDAFMMQLDIEGIGYDDREDAARIAMEIEKGEFKMQYPLFQDDEKSKRIESIGVSRLSISEFNPRKTRPTDYIERLAQRIARNGFEITRALWVYPEGAGYKVFAGGTRLQAAQLAALTEVPCVIHEGFNEEEIVGLADEDNENDEYHEPVSLVDTWMSYKALADAGWTQEQIARAKGCRSKGRVSERLTYASMPDSVLEKFQNDSMVESYAAELCKCSNLEHLEPWLDRESAMLHVIETVTKKSKFTAKSFGAEVERMNASVEKVESVRDQWEEKYFNHLLDDLRGIYDSAKVQYAIDKVTGQIAEDKRKAEEKARAEADAAEAARIEAEREEREAAHRMALNSIEVGQVWKCGRHTVICGDAYDLIDGIKADAVITDPPYGIGYQADWNKWDGSPSDFGPITGDDEKFNPAPFLGFRTVLLFGANYYSDQLPLGGWLCWDKRTKEKLDAMLGSPFELAWYRSEHTACRAIMIRIQHGGVVNADSEVGNNEKRYHATQKPIMLMEKIINELTQPGETILDPFAGSGTTLLACERAGAVCIAIEIEPENVSVILKRYEKETGREVCLESQG